MANGHGGYRQPANPAPVSGPGALSQRTDGVPHGGMDMETAQAPALPPAPPEQAAGPDLSQLGAFGAPSARPEEPISAGAPFGAGPGPALPPPGQLDEASRARLRSYLPVLVFMASSPDASSNLKQYVRQLRGELG